MLTLIMLFVVLFLAISVAALVVDIGANGWEILGVVLLVVSTLFLAIALLLDF